jgi:hypothetical protein
LPVPQREEPPPQEEQRFAGFAETIDVEARQDAVN